MDSRTAENGHGTEENVMEVECWGLDHANDTLGSSPWVRALHVVHTENGHQLHLNERCAASWPALSWLAAKLPPACVPSPRTMPPHSHLEHEADHTRGPQLSEHCMLLRRAPNMCA